MAAPSFATVPGAEKPLLVGFGRDAVLGVAGRVVEAVKRRHPPFLPRRRLRRRQAGPQLLHRFAEQAPKDCVILTLACGKYRFNKLDFGEIGGIPRLLDMGQCNDAYSAIQIAVALAGAFKCGVNELPLSMVLPGTSRRRWRSC